MSTTGMSWKEFFNEYGNKVAGSLFFAFQGDFEYKGIVHEIRDHSVSRKIRIILKEVSCRRCSERTEWISFGGSICTVRRRMTCFQEIKEGVFSLQLDDRHYAIVIFNETIRRRLEQREHNI